MTTTTLDSSTRVQTRAPEPADLKLLRAERLSPEAVLAARFSLSAVLPETLCRHSPRLSAECGVDIWLKREDLQVTGSFKERGALNALLGLTSDQRESGVVAASAGNHALGLAYHAQQLAIRVTLVMPETAAAVKVENCRRFGAEVVLFGSNFEDAHAYAQGLAHTRQARFVHPFDDLAVMAGQGSLALEALGQAPHAEAIVVPVGGGGLLAGVATAVRGFHPEVKVVAVEPENAASFQSSWRNGKPSTVPTQPTFADGLAVRTVGTRAFSSASDDVHSALTVTEEEIAYAMLRLFETERVTAEGAGATALAAVLANRCTDLRGRRVIVPVTGGNVDATTFASALQKGLAHRQHARAQSAA